MTVASFISVILMIGDAIGGSEKLGLKGTYLGSKIIFAGKAFGAAGMFGLSLGQVYNDSKALAEVYVHAVNVRVLRFFRAEGILFLTTYPSWYCL